MRVLVAVLTFKRENELQKCIFSVATAAQLVDASVTIVIGDNDPQSLCTQTYVSGVERVKIGLGSVAAGRQFLLSRARDEHYDYLAFIDDDEVVSSQWLEQMLGVAVRHDCGAVAGPVIPHNLSAMDFPLHARVRHTTGTELRSAGAGNLLINLNRVRNTNFDIDWAFPGGEDTDFTLRLSSTEGRIVWCDQGEVYEPVAENRLSRSWLIRRYFLNGRILCHAQRTLLPRSVVGQLPRRGAAVIAGTAKTLIMPTSPKTFRYFLDYSVRNIGYFYEALRGLQRR